MTVAETSRPTWPEYPVDLGRDLERLAQIDQKAAEESLCRYCKPVELYNIIQRRALIQPAFLQRNLDYKIQAAREKRIKMGVTPLSPSNALDSGLRFFVMVTTALPSPGKVNPDKDAFRMSCSRLISLNEEATFLLPEIRKLQLKLGKENHFIILVTMGDGKLDSEATLVGYKGLVFWGKMLLSTFCNAWLERSRSNAAAAGDFRLQSDLEFQHAFFQHEDFQDGKCIRFTRLNSGTANLPFIKLQISGEEAGPSLLRRDASDVPKPSSSSSQLRTYGRVYFHYLYFFGKLRKLEVTENFSCPFCLVKCASFIGLKCHLDSSHDLFKFEFVETEEIHAVVVACKTEIEGDDRDVDAMSDPRLKSFAYCSKSCSVRRRKSPPKRLAEVTPNTQAADGPRLHKSDSGVSSSGQNFKQMVSVNLIDGLDKPQISTKEYMKMTLAGKRFPLPLPKKRRLETSDTLQTIYPEKGSGSLIRAAVPRSRTDVPTGNKLVPSPKKGRKVSSERAEARNRALLQKRQFFHSHTAQPMELEQLLSDKDSEDELDDSVAGFEDRRMLNEFVDVGKEEKELMHRWNSFVRRQKIVADGHCPWGVEAFAKMHANELKPPTMRRSFMLMLVKLWNHHLINGFAVDRCLSIVDSS